MARKFNDGHHPTIPALKNLDSNFKAMFFDILILYPYSLTNCFTDTGANLIINNSCDIN